MSLASINQPSINHNHVGKNVSPEQYSRIWLCLHFITPCSNYLNFSFTWFLVHGNTHRLCLSFRPAVKCLCLITDVHVNVALCLQGWPRVLIHLSPSKCTAGKWPHLQCSLFRDGTVWQWLVNVYLTLYLEVIWKWNSPSFSACVYFLRSIII